jgi:hypothetical protein
VPKNGGAGIPGSPVYRKDIIEQQFGLLILLALRKVAEFVNVLSPDLEETKVGELLDLQKEVKVLTKYVDKAPP